MQIATGRVRMKSKLIVAEGDKNISTSSKEKMFVYLEQLSK
jgi:hypothetical protein